MTTQEYEAELEKEKETLEKQLHEAESKYDTLFKKNTKLLDEKKELRSEANQNDDQIEKL